ncbi:MAG: hypothetical protein Q9183_005328, partial [Haloplaca sp. 2 TL-2023]
IFEDKNLDIDILGAHAIWVVVLAGASGTAKFEGENGDVRVSGEIAGWNKTFSRLPKSAFVHLFPHYTFSFSLARDDRRSFVAMNCPSRTDEWEERTGWNQSPPGLSGDLTTRADLNGISNLRNRREAEITTHGPSQTDGWIDLDDYGAPKEPHPKPGTGHVGEGSKESNETKTSDSLPAANPHQPPRGNSSSTVRFPHRVAMTLVKFSKFIGPGFMVAVAYIDPGNYSTDVAAGASKRFRLLFIILMSNIFAALLQSLAVRLGTVSGLNLAESCRAHLPRWINIALYLVAEAAIIATDIAEVGSNEEHRFSRG